MPFLREHQLEILLFLSGVCACLALFAVFFKALQPARKSTLIAMSLCSIWLLLADYTGWTHLGDKSFAGYVLVRFCNFSVFLTTLLLIHLFNTYVSDLCAMNTDIKRVPARLKLANVFGYVGEFLICLNLGTGIYYTFDETNTYQRSDTLFLAYIFPLAMVLLQLSTIITYYKHLRPLIRVSILSFSIVPLVASVLQVFIADISFTDMALVAFVILLHVFVLIDLNKEIHEMHAREITAFQEEQKHDYLLLSQTADALSSAIEAKDRYTHGHSKRVAKYAEMIARMAGEDKDTCEQVYLAAMLHDVGKIGIPENIINKAGKLTDEEYDIIKQHTIRGMMILDKIRISPNLSVGALWHHERYDGMGYPDGLRGDEIPKIARIIAVADSYDAMTSLRSYRKGLTQAQVRMEIEAGRGTQFDPVYADIMLQLIDSDTDYALRELR